MTPSQALNAAERTGFPSELYVCSPVLSIEDSAREWLHPITVQHQARLLLSSPTYAPGGRVRSRERKTTSWGNMSVKQSIRIRGHTNIKFTEHGLL